MFDSKVLLVSSRPVERPRDVAELEGAVVKAGATQEVACDRVVEPDQARWIRVQATTASCPYITVDDASSIILAEAKIATMTAKWKRNVSQ